ncbi:MAG: Hemerythrin cation binding region [Polaromonas sp.]|nr:Hemerythrin cation binding region [Polaromonas sp.]
MTRTTLRTILNEHASLSAMLQSILMMLARGPEDEPEKFFNVLRAMLFYIDEFPEKQHHPKESDLLFPKVVRVAPETMATVERLERDHMNGEVEVRELQHELLAWELLGDTHRKTFEAAARRYASFYMEHMQLEETVILPAARKGLSPADWEELDAAFGANRDPLHPSNARDPAYDRLFTRIVMRAPAPIGLGSPGHQESQAIAG